MKHEITTLNTKKTIAASLKKLMEKKPLSKITVSDIVADCKINRKTFYYHFEDIQALLKWMLEEEAVEVVKQFDLIFEYEDAIIFVLDYVDKNKHILNCAYDSIGRDELRNFFYQDFFNIMMALIERVEELENITTDNEYKEFLCEFYTEALVGILIEILKSKGETDRQKIIDYVSRTLKFSIPALLREAEKK